MPRSTTPVWLALVTVCTLPIHGRHLLFVLDGTALVASTPFCGLCLRHGVGRVPGSSILSCMACVLLRCVYACVCASCR